MYPNKKHNAAKAEEETSLSDAAATKIQCLFRRAITAKKREALEYGYAQAERASVETARLLQEEEEEDAEEETSSSSAAAALPVFASKRVHDQLFFPIE